LSAVIWHDLECGIYRADLSIWVELARQTGGPILDVGAGTGRVSLALARAGFPVVALDSDGVLLAALRERAGELPIETVHADARSFELGRAFPLCVVPMQTIQLLGGERGRAGFFGCARRHLVAGGLLAIAISPTVEEFRWRDGDPLPLPDLTELDGTVYSSQPTAVRRDGSVFVLERRREIIAPDGGHTIDEDRIALDLVDAQLLIREAAELGLQGKAIKEIPATSEHIGGEVVRFGA
jgi:SAM-dependent methyltransferase